MNETPEQIDARFYGMDYVIAGRMMDLLNPLVIDAHTQASETGDGLATKRWMDLWSVRFHIVQQYRRIK